MMANQGNPTNPAQIYSEAGLAYIRYPATIDTKANGQKKINGKRPAYTKIENQPRYTQWSGDYYSLLMGREFQPGRFAILLDFDNKAEGDLNSGFDLVKKLNMNQYNAPKQLTASNGVPLHLLF